MKPLFLVPFSRSTRRNLFTVSVFVAASFLLSTLNAADQGKGERNTVRLLTVGNSFADNALFFLPSLARAGGKELVVFRANLGNCSLERHAIHMRFYEEDPRNPAGRPYQNHRDPKTGFFHDFSLQEALASYPWDFVTIQQASALSFRAESFQPFAGMLIDTIHHYAPQAEVMVYETWAYREDHPFFKGGNISEPAKTGESRDLTPAKMYALLAKNYRNLAAQNHLRLLPVGDAFELARATPRWHFAVDPSFDYEHPAPGALPNENASLNVGWEWRPDDANDEYSFLLDAKHTSFAGRYLAASVFYLVLFNANEVPAGFAPPGLTADDAKGLRQIAEKAVATERIRPAAR